MRAFFVGGGLLSILVLALIVASPECATYAGSITGGQDPIRARYRCINFCKSDEGGNCPPAVSCQLDLGQTGYCRMLKRIASQICVDGYILNECETQVEGTGWCAEIYENPCDEMDPRCYTLIDGCGVLYGCTGE
jgi:hypothetical protein